MQECWNFKGLCNRDDAENISKLVQRKVRSNFKRCGSSGSKIQKTCEGREQGRNTVIISHKYEPNHFGVAEKWCAQRRSQTGNIKAGIWEQTKVDGTENEKPRNTAGYSKASFNDSQSSKSEQTRSQEAPKERKYWVLRKWKLLSYVTIQLLLYFHHIMAPSNNSALIWVIIDGDLEEQGEDAGRGGETGFDGGGVPQQ